MIDHDTIVMLFVQVVMNSSKSRSGPFFGSTKRMTLDIYCNDEMKNCAPGFKNSKRAWCARSSRDAITCFDRYEVDTNYTWKAGVGDQIDPTKLSCI